MAWEKLGTASVGGTAITNTSWKELGRTTLGSTGDTIDVSSFAAKDNLMILGHRIQSGACNMLFRFNADSGSNYASRHSHNGGTDSTSTSQTSSTAIMSGDSSDAFAVQYVTNITNQEKLVLSNSITQSATGAGTAPNRREKVYKWANTSYPITSVNCFNDESGGDYAVGSEVVVLGFDNDEADSGTNFWQELTTTEATGAVSGTWSTDTFATKKYLWIQTYFTGANQDPVLRLGTGGSIDTGSNYSYRFNYNNGSDQTGTSNTGMAIGSTASGTGFNNTFIINKSDKEKLVMNENNRADTAGAGTAPDYRFEGVGKWSNTSGQIDKIGWQKGSGNVAGAGSYIKVWGAD